jgi:hypothetical protein
LKAAEPRVTTVTTSIASDVPAAFEDALAAFRADPILVLGHNDADGLAASGILARALLRLGRVVYLIEGRTPFSRSASSTRPRCSLGLKRLRTYRKERDETRGVWKYRPS